MSVPFVVAIPARLGSTRLPQKPLRMLAGRPLIVHVVERARAAGARDIVVATDAAAIADALTTLDVRVCMTRTDHASGTDRLAEVADQLGWPGDTVVVNLQGDEPLAPADGIAAVARVLVESDCSVATLATPVQGTAQLFDPNCVKVVRDARGRALYFSRAPMPWARDEFAKASRSGVSVALPDQTPFLRHIGIYAYRAEFLRTFTSLPKGVLEQAESLEQLRVLEAGFEIAVGLSPADFPAGVDTEDDLLRIERLLAENVRQ